MRITVYISFILLFLNVGTVSAEPTLDEFPEMTDDAFWKALNEDIQKNGVNPNLFDALNAELVELCQEDDAPYWADVYHLETGSTTNETLVIHPDVGFVWISTGCFHWIVVGFGTAELQDNRLVLENQLSDTSESYNRVPSLSLFTRQKNAVLVPEALLIRYHQDIGYATGATHNRTEGCFYAGKTLSVPDSTVSQEFQLWVDTPTVVGARVSYEERSGIENEMGLPGIEVKLSMGAEVGLSKGVKIYAASEDGDRMLTRVIESTVGTATVQAQWEIYDEYFRDLKPIEID